MKFFIAIAEKRGIPMNRLTFATDRRWSVISLKPSSSGIVGIGPRALNLRAVASSRPVTLEESAMGITRWFVKLSSIPRLRLYLMKKKPVILYVDHGPTKFLPCLPAGASATRLSR
jgi:hypothetical protein